MRSASYLKHTLPCLLGLLTLCATAQAQFFTYVEPASPGSVEDWLNTNNFTWVRIPDSITVGSYVEDLISDYRANQPAGRGRVGIVTATSWNEYYNCMGATVDFWRDYSVGIVFPELSAIQLVAIPEPSNLAVLLPGVLLARAAVRSIRKSRPSRPPKRLQETSGLPRF